MMVWIRLDIYSDLKNRLFIERDAILFPEEKILVESVDAGWWMDEKCLLDKDQTTSTSELKLKQSSAPFFVCLAIVRTKKIVSPHLKPF